MKNKPDKYCAWHPEKGWLGHEYLLGMRSDFDDALEELREAFETEFQEACDETVMDCDFATWIRAQGWEIRPVWLHTEPPVEWISVEDELPPMRERILVWNSKQVYLVSRQFDDETQDWDWFYDGMNGGPLNVTHWRPLPEAPSEKKKKESEND